jgi:phospholipid/cholesterol/gamma-HCH transport system substrate-binding protein
MTSRKKIIVGAFLIGGAALFAVGLFLIGNHHQFFGQFFDVYTSYSAVDTIESGAKVRVSGMDAGQVSAIRIPRDASGKFIVTLHIQQKFRPLVREDSVTSIATEGMVGNKFVNVEKGKDSSPECSGCVLPSHEPVEMSQLLTQAQGMMKTTESTISDLHTRLDQTVENITSAAGHADGMIVSMRGNVEKIASNGSKITSGVDALVSDIRSGKGTAGKLLTDKSMAQNVESTVQHAKDMAANLDQASGKAATMVSDFEKKNIPEELHQTLANTRDLTGKLSSAVSGFESQGKGGQSTVTDVRQTIAEAHRASENLASDTEAIKHNFFLRGFFSRRGYFNLNHLNPSEYADSKFVKHPKQRIWLAADGLFAPASDGAQKLTSNAGIVLDSAMSRIVPYLPNNPIVIEGYAEAGSAAQRFLEAQQRAEEVRQYLDSHFHLNPDLVGIIPLGDKPPHGVEMDSWNGICLALVVSKD